MASADVPALASAFEVLPGDVAALRLVADVVFAVMYALALVIVVVDGIGAVLWSKESSFCVQRAVHAGDQRRPDALERELSRRKIQFGDVRTNPFQRAARTATIEARIAAGVGGTTLSLIDVREEDAACWLAWLKPGGNVVE